MKKLIILLLSIMVAAGVSLFVACGGGNDNGGGNNNSGGNGSSNGSTTVPDDKTDPEPDPDLANFTGITFTSKEVTYNGEEQSILISGDVPSGTDVKYTNNTGTNAGQYKASVKLTKEGYNALTLNATLTINKADFSGLTYQSVSVKYDGKDHLGDIQLVGNQPSGTSVKQTVKDSGGNLVGSAIGIGTYYYTVEVTNANYNKLTLTATLIISAEQTDMPVFASGDGTVYFANGLDKGYIYSLSANGTVTRIDFSTPKEFSRASSSSALFITGSVFLNSVKEIKNGSTNVLYTDGNIDDFVKYSDSVYYYSSNSLTASKSGIYKVDASNSSDEPVVTRIFEGKSDNLAIYGNFLYFTNGNDKNYLYKMNLTTNATSLVLSEKVHEYIIDGSKLYCTVNGLANDYIGYLDLSSSSTDATKLTNSAGELLRVKNGYLYYHYTDLFSIVDASKKGIWRIDISSKTESQVVEKEVNGFDVDSSGNIVYISTDDLHLYRYYVSSGKTTDLLEGFVAPETTPLNTGGRTIAYGNKVYYLNMYAGKTLYVYDEETKTNSQLTANKVADFYIYGDTLYFNQVTMLTNNDLYCVNLKVSSEAVKLNSNDVRNMVSDGTYLYATHYNWAGAAGGISRMKLDGTEYVKFSEINGAKNLTIKDGNLYFINCATGQDNGNIEYYKLSDITATSEKLASTNLSKNIKNVKQFIFDGDNIFYLYNGLGDNSVRRTDFDTLGEGVKLASSKTNPNEMIIKGDYVYYYSYATTALSSAGFYKVRKDATGDGTQELILGYDKTYYGSDFAITDSGNLYFLNYIPKLTFGNAHTYQLNLTSYKVTKIA